MMVSHGAFTQTGELLVDPRYLPQVYDDFFGGMLDLFLSFSARSVAPSFDCLFNSCLVGTGM